MNNNPEEQRSFWHQVEPGIRRILIGMSPWLASALVLAYFSILHGLFLFSALEFSIWMLLLLAPPVLFELWYTGFFEVKRYDWKLVTKSGLFGRMLFIVCCFYFCVWYTLLFNHTPDPVVGLFRKWPHAVRIFWTASPNLSIILAVLLAGFYFILTYKYRLFRLVTTIALPAGATFLLAHLFYLHPGSALRLAGGQRPSFIQRIFPSDDLPGSLSVFSPPLFARGLYVTPDDSFAVMTFGATFGTNVSDQPNHVWVELPAGRLGYKRMAQTRYFFSECPTTIYSAPWHGSTFHGFDPQTRTYREHTLPDRVGGFPVFEIAYTYHACDPDTIYLLNTRNPVLFAWDGRSDSLRNTLPLAERGLLRVGDQAIAIARNQAKKTLYLISVGKYELIELNENTLEPVRTVNLPQDPLGIRVSSDGRYLYLTAAFRKKLWKLDTESLAILKTFDAPLHCRHLLLSPDERVLLAPDFLSGEIFLIDSDTGAQLKSFYVTPKLEGMYMTRRFIYLLGSEGLFRAEITEMLGTTSSLGE